MQAGLLDSAVCTATPGTHLDPLALVQDTLEGCSLLHPFKPWVEHAPARHQGRCDSLQWIQPVRIVQVGKVSWLNPRKLSLSTNSMIPQELAAVISIQQNM